MINIQPRFIIAGTACFALFVLAFRDYLGLLVLVSVSFLPVLILIVVVAGIGIAALRTLHSPQPRVQRNQETLSVGSSASTPLITPLAQRLQSAFRRNQTAQLDQALATLPTWPITQRVRATAHVLLALKQSIYRAQAEGVPAAIVQRYLNNTQQAADALWQLASKLDALGKQQVAYNVVAPQLQGEEQRVAQLQQSAQTAQEGIALLIISGIQSDAFKQVDEDLSALTMAVRSVISLPEKAVQPAYVK